MIYAAATLLSAFLLFLVEPLLGKFLLPWFGGAPAVWTTCMLFFQVVLLAGYFYAHLIDRFLGLRGQGRLHAALILISILAIGLQALRWGRPLLPAELAPTAPDSPIVRILFVLTASVGLPFLLLSSTAPLVQRWYAAARQTAFPYRLYALSNAGSLLGLLCYPFALEPTLGLPFQAILWTAAYALFAALCALVAWRAANGALVPAPAEPEDRPAGRVSGDLFVFWLLLAAAPSSMLLAVTNRLCLELAAVPFLWVLPLLLYLLSFIVCFHGPRGYRRGAYVPAGAILTLVVLITERLGAGLRVQFHVLSFSAFLFVFCMLCHGEVVRSRPAARRLTLFYLAIALGGALGGIFVGAVAPAVFPGLWEFHLTILAGWALLVVILFRDRSSLLFTGDRRSAAAFIFFLSYLAIRYLLPFLGDAKPAVARSHPALFHVSAAALLAAAIVAPVWRRPGLRSRAWPRLLLGAVIFFVECFLIMELRGGRTSAVAAARNFYGVLRVRDFPASNGAPPSRNLIHGQINHGFQFLSPELAQQAVSYYVRGSGVQLAIDSHPRRAAAASRPLRIGVTGLGAGAMAVYAGSNDVIRFYEINPAVIEYAAGPSALFSYVNQCRGRAEIVPGDARLSLQRERADGKPGRFDVLVLDAFSSDSIPVHLLTLEAFAVYRAHLRDRDSVIAVNVSNRFLNLRPLVFSVADRLGLEAGLFNCKGEPPQPAKSIWILLTRNPAFFKQEPVASRQTAYQRKETVVWTDTYSGLFRLLRWD